MPLRGTFSTHTFAERGHQPEIWGQSYQIINKTPKKNQKSYSVNENDNDNVNVNDNDNDNDNGNQSNNHNIWHLR